VKTVKSENPKEMLLTSQVRSARSDDNIIYPQILIGKVFELSTYTKLMSFKREGPVLREASIPEYSFLIDRFVCQIRFLSFFDRGFIQLPPKNGY
jgi:hypothetical protein